MESETVAGNVVGIVNVNILLGHKHLAVGTFNIPGRPDVTYRHIAAYKGELTNEELPTQEMREFALLMRRAWKNSEKIGNRNYFNKVDLSDDTQLSLIKETPIAHKYIHNLTDQASKLQQMMWNL